MHPLDRPIWSALTGRQAALALDNGQTCRIDPAIGLFAAAATPDDVAALADLFVGDTPLVLFEGAAPTSPPEITVSADAMVQMIADRLDPPGAGAPIVPLGEADAPEMLALATLTRPGPFLARTHRLGGFVGIREGGRLAAMAGTRLRVPGHVEISAVCTHPDHRGRGHAARLMQTVANALVAGGDRPFLHTFAHNAGAIALYERLGFRVRRGLTMAVLTRAAGAT